jgi:hypothetical protein
MSGRQGTLLTPITLKMPIFPLSGISIPAKGSQTG